MRPPSTRPATFVGAPFSTNVMLDLRAAHACVRRERLIAGTPAELLELLFELRSETTLAIGLAELPGARDLGGHDPQVRAAVLGHRALVRLPIVHAKRVRDHARAGLHLQDRRPQPQVQFGQQVQRHHRRGAEVGFEYIALDDAHALAELLGLHVTLRQPCQLRIVFDADGLRAEIPGRCDGDLAIACAEVVDAVGSRSPAPSSACARRGRRWSAPRRHPCRAGRSPA